MCRTALSVFITFLSAVAIIADIEPPNASNAPVFSDDDEPNAFKNLTQQSLQQLSNILLNQSLTRQQQNDAMIEWASGQGEGVQNLVMDEISGLQNMIETMNVKIDESNMTEIAKAALYELQSVLINMNITPAESEKQITNIIKALPQQDQLQVNHFFVNMTQLLMNAMTKQLN